MEIGVVTNLTGVMAEIVQELTTLSEDNLNNLSLLFSNDVLAADFENPSETVAEITQAIINLSQQTLSIGNSVEIGVNFAGNVTEIVQEASNLAQETLNVISSLLSSDELPNLRESLAEIAQEISNLSLGTLNIIPLIDSFDQMLIDILNSSTN